MYIKVYRRIRNKMTNFRRLYFLLFTLILFTLICTRITTVCAQTPLGAEDLIKRSIAYHDPNGNWSTLNAKFVVRRFQDLLDTVSINFVDRSFERSNQYGTLRIDNDICLFGRKGSVIHASAEGFNTPPSDSICKLARHAQQYETYLFSLPMNLQDETFVVDSMLVDSVHWNGSEYLRLQYGIYKNENYTEVWNFYFDPKNYALKAYYFHPLSGDYKGEYVMLHNDMLIDGIKSAKLRIWYSAENDEQIRTEEIIQQIP